jgi:hypothetical protein
MFWTFLLNDQAIREDAFNLNTIAGLKLSFPLFLAHDEVPEILVFVSSLKAMSIWKSFLEEAFVVIIWRLEFSLAVIFIVKILSSILDFV